VNTSDLALIQDFANREIVKFHEARLRRLDRISLDDVLKRRNPYLFRARNLVTASELVSAILGAYLSSSEEECFGQFLESLAIYVSSLACDGRKSVAQGIDLEFDRDELHCAVAVESGPHCSNSLPIGKLEDNMMWLCDAIGLPHHSLSYSCMCSQGVYWLGAYRPRGD